LTIAMFRAFDNVYLSLALCDLRYPLHGIR